MEKTIAQAVADRFGNDGLRWQIEENGEEVHLIDAIREAGGVRHRTVESRDADLHLFEDGSAIVRTDTGWDVVEYDEEHEIWCADGGWRFRDAGIWGNRT